MKFINKYILRFVAVMSLCVIVASCSHDEFDMIPENDRSLKFIASVDDLVTRADDTGFWANGDTIRVRIDSYPWVGKYVLNTDGSVQDAIDALAWPYPDGLVSAWYPFLEEGTEVAIIDQSAGYHNIDFLAAQTDRVMNYKEVVNLNFVHQMTKVSCMLTNGDGVTAEDIKTAKVSYSGFPTVVFSEDGISGKGADAYITPTSDFSALLVPQDMSGKPFIKVDLTVTVNGTPIPKTLIYTPEPGTVTLEAGKAYTYNIKVQKDRLEIETISAAWTESLKNAEPTSDKYHIYLSEDTGDLGDLEFSSNVTEKSADTRAGSVRCLEVLGDYFTISYKVTTDNCHLGIVFANKETKNEVKRSYYEKQNSVNDGYYEFSYKIVSQISDTVYLKKDEYMEVGDYLFNDGKWGSIPEKIYKGEKTPIGIVFKVGAGGDSQHNTLDVPANYGWNENELEIRGYAVALNDASEGRLRWAETSVGNKTLDVTFSYNVNNIPKLKYSGIIATNKAKVKGIANYPAFKAAIEFKAAGESPTATLEGSSGWYLPSYRQLTDIHDLFTHPQRRELITKAGGNFFKQPDKNAYSYCSTTERSSNLIWVQKFVYPTSDPNDDSGVTKNKTYQFFVRSVLTLSKSAEK